MEMSRVSRLNRPAPIRCPNCGNISIASPLQLEGRSSLVCRFCGFHFYITPKVDGIAEVWEGYRAELVK